MPSVAGTSRGNLGGSGSGVAGTARGNLTGGGGGGESGDGGRSLLGQTWDLVRGAPSAVLNIATDPGAAAATGAMIGLPFGGVGAVVGGAAGGAVGLLGGGIRHLAGSDAGYFDTSEEMVDSFKRTGGRFAHPSRYLDAVDESGIVGALVEDIGNVTMVAAPATRAFAAPSAAAKAGAATELAAAGKTLQAATSALDDAARVEAGTMGAAFQGGFDPMAAVNVARARTASQAARKAVGNAQGIYDAAATRRPS